MQDTVHKALAFLTHEPIFGELLAERLARGPMAPAEALKAAVEIGGLLQQAHAAGFVHGALTTRKVVLTDAGARILEAPAGAAAIITPYTSPEVVRGSPPDARSDVFSFGAIVYEMVTGWPPFTGEDEEELRKAILERSPAPIATLLSGLIPAAAASLFASLDGLVRGCLNKSADRRRQRVQNVVTELKLIVRPLARVAAPARRRVPGAEIIAPARVTASTNGHAQGGAATETPAAGETRGAAGAAAKAPAPGKITPEATAPAETGAAPPPITDAGGAAERPAGPGTSPAVVEPSPAGRRAGLEAPPAPPPMAPAPTPGKAVPEAEPEAGPSARRTADPPLADHVTALALPPAPLPEEAHMALTSEEPMVATRTGIAPLELVLEPELSAEPVSPPEAHAAEPPEPESDAVARPIVPPPPAEPLLFPADAVPEPEAVEPPVTDLTPVPREVSPESGAVSPALPHENETPAHQPRFGKLLERLAPTLEEDLLRAGEPGAPGQDAATAPESPSTPVPPPESAPKPRVRPVEPSPRPAVTGRAPLVPGQVTYATRPRPRFWFIAAGLLVAALAGSASVLYWTRQPEHAVPRPAAPLPPQPFSYPGAPAVSPDGRRVAFSAVGRGGERMLWVRSLDVPRTKVVPGSAGGFAPFWSPDGQHIAFFADRTLKRVAVSGGAAQVICAAEALAGGGTWNAGGIILFAPGLDGALFRVPASGGSPEPVTRLNVAKRERAHLWPQFLPDGQHFLFFARADIDEASGVFGGAFGSSEVKPVLISDTDAIYADAGMPGGSKPGSLIFIRDRNLMVQAFDTAALAVRGEPALVAEDVGPLRSLGLAPVSVSGNDVLVYQAAGKPVRQLVWCDRSGRALGAVPEPGEYGPPRVSPDGASVVVGKLQSSGEAADLWIVHSDNSASSLTATVEHEGSPVWSPDGSRVAYFSTGQQGFDIYAKPVSGSGPVSLFKDALAKYPSDWSPDGRYILFSSVAGNNKSDLWVLNVADRRAVPLTRTVYAEGYGVFSPDGNWIAYQSDESGRAEVYVQPLRPEGIGHLKYQVSSGGGGLPRWRRDGKELFYMTSGGRLMAAAVRTDNGNLAFDPPATLFQTHPVPRIWNLYDAAPDGQKFLVNVPVEWSNTAPITVLSNWPAQMKR